MHVYMCIYTNASSSTLSSFPSGVGTGFSTYIYFLFIVNFHHLPSSSPHFWRTKNGIQYKALGNFGLLGNLFFFFLQPSSCSSIWHSFFSISRGANKRDPRRKRGKEAIFLYNNYDIPFGVHGNTDARMYERAQERERVNEEKKRNGKVWTHVTKFSYNKRSLMPTWAVVVVVVAPCFFFPS